jgi:hypothetical protein
VVLSPDVLDMPIDFNPFDEDGVANPATAGKVYVEDLERVNLLPPKLPV